MNCKTCGKPMRSGELLVDGECILCIAMDRDRLREETERLQAIVDTVSTIVEFVASDCGIPHLDQPCIYRRGNKWRYHRIRAGNEWEDGDTPLAAILAISRR